MLSEKFSYAAVFFVSTSLAPFGLSAQASDFYKELSNTITSVAVAKAEIRKTLKDSDDCPTGSCLNFAYTYVCDVVFLLDVKLAYALSSTMTRGTPEILIQPNDLKYMRKILQQCKPSNYQQWNFEGVTHAVYQPSEEASIEISKYLDLD